MTESDPPAEHADTTVQQEVTAAGGFAQAVIHGDIHVFGDGTPVYVLENWKAAPRADRGWLREMPSRMLNARFQVVGFTGRRDELDELRTWRDNGQRLEVRWLSGSGGQGKTRLAAELARESVEAGWKVVTAIHGPGSVLPAPISQDLAPEGSAGLLLIVDYADRWPPQHLLWLLSNTLLHHVGVMTRVLMLARSTDSWPSIRAALANHQAGTTEQVLGAVPGLPGFRHRMFSAARDSFAHVYGVEDYAGISSPASLDPAEFGLTLALHMAALVAVDSHVSGGRPPGTAAGLTMYLLDREHLHWVNLFGDEKHRIEPSGQAYATPPAVMKRAVFTAALTGVQSRPAGEGIIRAVRLAHDPRPLLTDHATCYPPADERDAVLEPLYPDRLAEDFIALTVPGHHVGFPADMWAGDVLSKLLTRKGGGRQGISNATRVITFLSAASERWPHVSRRYLCPILRGDPQLAVHAGSPVLASLAANPNVPEDVLEQIRLQLPGSLDIDLAPGVAAVYTRVADYRLSRTKNAGDRARIYEKLSVRQSQAGLRAEALASAEAGEQAWRGLVARNPSRYEADLAGSLSNLSVFLADMGRREEALVAVEEATQIHRRLSARDPGRYEPGLAGSLLNLGSRLWAMGRREEAVAATREAADLRRQLARADPVEYEADLAASLSNLSSLMPLNDQVHLQEPLDLADEAAGIYRRLAAAAPGGRFDPELATTLAHLSTLLASTGRPGEALAVAEEAVAVRRRLARSVPVLRSPGNSP